MRRTTRFAAVGPMAVVASCLAAGLLTAGSVAATASSSGIRLGARVELPVSGRDAEDPVLAMNASGRVVIAYAETDPFGPFGVLAGDAASGKLERARVRQLGAKVDLSPLEPAVGADGQTALGWSVRRQLHPANRVAFGIDSTTLANAPRARWTSHAVLAPTVSYDPSDDSPTLASSAFVGRRLIQDWTTQTASASRLVFARQDANGNWHTRVLLHTGSDTTIGVGGLAVNGSGRAVIAASLQPVLDATAASAPTHPKRESAVAFSSTSSGRIGAPQMLRRGCSVAGVAIAIGGRAAIVMLCNEAAGRSQVWISESAPAGRFGAPLRVSGPGVDGVFPSASFSVDGRVCVAWDRVVGSAKTFDANIVRTEVNCAAPGHRFDRPTWQTGPYPTQINGPQILNGPSGPALTRGDQHGRVVLQRLFADRRLGPTIALSGPGSRNQTVDVDTHGDG
ncbi:MAG: hypothetical protein ACRDK8_02890, partial [Solirubrobacteraceae bacterium]